MAIDCPTGEEYDADCAKVTREVNRAVAELDVLDAARKVAKKLSSLRNPKCVTELKRCVEVLEALEKA